MEWKCLGVVSLVLLAACSSAPKKVDVPSLTPQEASALLQFDNKAHSWLEYVKRTNPGCEYHIDLPDQSNNPAEIDLDHIVWCANRPSPKEFDASAVFIYDKATQKWILQRFSS